MCLAIPGKILSIHAEGGALFAEGKVDFEGVVQTVSLAAVPEARVGDYVLVHVGMALTVIDEAQALQTLADFKAMKAQNRDES